MTDGSGLVRARPSHPEIAHPQIDRAMTELDAALPELSVDQHHDRYAAVPGLLRGIFDGTRPAA